LLLIPLQVDVPRERLPLANWLIIVVIIGFFAWQINQVKTYHTTISDELNHIASNQSSHAFKIKTDLFKGFVLKDWNMRGLLGHMFLHGGWMHIIGNLLFLWIFGNAVSAKIGNLKFMLIYLLLGIGAGAAHLYFKGGASVGASGAINGIVGMYLVLFPTNSISCLFVIILPIYYVKVFEVSSYVMIFYWLIFDILGAFMGGGNTAYYAHLGGFAGGVIVASLLLQMKIVKMCNYEKSIFQVFSRQPVKEEYKTLLYNRVPANDYATNGKTQNESKTSAAANDEFIRVKCECGMKCKISAQFSGRMAKCPRCRQPVRIP